MWISRVAFETLIRDSEKFKATSEAKDGTILFLMDAIRDLKETIQLLEKKVDREQTRADRAIDTLIVKETNLPPVSDPIPTKPEEDELAEDPKDAKRIITAITEGRLDEVFHSKLEVPDA
jgi:hypothetical protein